jgi:DNA-directed RNA polymerase subunit RPC12/RpoP
MKIHIHFRPGDKKPDLRCPNCENDWFFGWEKPSEVKVLLEEKKGIRCSKCKEEFAT